MSTRKKVPLRNFKNCQKLMKWVVRYIFPSIIGDFQTLSDADKKASYDQGGQTSSGPNFGGGWQYQSSRSAEDIFRSMFGNLNMDPFGGAFAESVDGFGASQEILVNLSFEEAARGAVKNVTYNSIDNCIKCRGSGVELGYKKVQICTNYFLIHC